MLHLYRCTATSCCSLYCGFDNAIEIFDLSAPGAEGYRLQTTPTRGSRQGQKGPLSLRLSLLDLTWSSAPRSPCRHHLHPRLLSLARHLPSRSRLFLGLNRSLRPQFRFVPGWSTWLKPKRRSDQGRPLQVLFHPTVPHLLFCASRQSNHLEVYDLRNFSSEAGRIRRKGRTNQRLGAFAALPSVPIVHLRRITDDSWGTGFDVDPTGTWLAAGDQVRLSLSSSPPSRRSGGKFAQTTPSQEQDGNLSIFDAQLAAMGDSEQTVEPISTFAISKEPVGAALFRPAFPHIPQLVTCSGTRHFAHAPKRRAVHGGGGTLNSDSEDTEEEDEQREQEQEHEAREEEQTPSLELWQWN
ncbi:SPOSA6832_03976, partial [Sporobolomyces salmonicolor]